MKLFAIISTFVLAGVAQANMDCTCTSPVWGGDTAPVTSMCCTNDWGIHFPDGVEREGVFNAESNACRLPTDGLGFSVEQMTEAFGACCGATGNGIEGGYEGSCVEV
ncbi:hypothetical protein NX059_008696 [Plenodomus lindquistii]|nr:hypothetical protein NX059_008696 [Plenodomus lindquistii]